MSLFSVDNIYVSNKSSRKPPEKNVNFKKNGKKTMLYWRGNMPRSSNNKRMKFLFLVALILFFSACFQTNFFHFAEKSFFQNFQKDSEALVVGGIAANHFSLEKNNYNLGFIYKENYKNNSRPKDYRLYAYYVISNKPEDIKLSYIPYKSQYGIQGVVYSRLYNQLGFNSISNLQTISSILLATVFAALFFLYRRIYDNCFAVVFLITMISSPWIISFARNLYWAPFLWFLPSLLAAMLYLTKNTTVRSLLLFGVAALIFVKSLAGYEYLSTITLFTCSVFIVAPFFRDSDRELQSNIRMFFLVLLACIAGFFCALLVHANMRGDTILDGLKIIIEHDVKRRTYGDASLFDPVYKASLESNPLAILKTYIASWKTPLVLWLPGSTFKFLALFGLISVSIKAVIRNATWKRDAVLLAFFFTVPASWLVLAKAHSYIHTSMNFVVWYFGFVQALVYIALKSITLSPRYLFNKREITGSRDS